MSKNDQLRDSDPRGVAFVAEVRAQIERMIGAGRLSAGARINETALAQEMGVSRGPIREACRALEHQGILHSQLNRGFFVRDISIKEALDIYEMRASMSGMAGRLAAQVISVSEIETLRDLVRQMDDAMEAEDLGSFYHLNNEFHRQLVDIADNAPLQEFWQQLEAQLYLYRRSGYRMPGSMRESNEVHRQIVEALAIGDAVSASNLMKRHVMRGRARMLQSLDPETLNGANEKN